MKKYPVVTLCGSTRFKKEFEQIQKKLTLNGCIVISVGLFDHSGDNEVLEQMDDGINSRVKMMLDDMHKSKIDMADSIYVINPGGYIGESTWSEICYAKMIGKDIDFIEPVPDYQIAKMVQKHIAMAEKLAAEQIDWVQHRSGYYNKDEDCVTFTHKKIDIYDPWIKEEHQGDAFVWQAHHDKEISVENPFAYYGKEKTARFVEKIILKYGLANDKGDAESDEFIITTQEKEILVDDEEAYEKLCKYVHNAYVEYEEHTSKTICNADGVYMRAYPECDEINLWTYWQGRGCYHPQIILFGQDWGCPFDGEETNLQYKVRTIKKQALSVKEDDRNHYFDNEEKVYETDINLRELFASLDMGYDDILTRRYEDLYFTNMCLGYRNKGTSGKFIHKWITDIEKKVHPELIARLHPKVIICLGKDTYECLLGVLGLKDSRKIGKFNDLIEENSKNPIKYKDIPIFVFAHCGAMGTLNRNGKKDNSLDLQKKDWAHIKKYL